MCDESVNIARFYAKLQEFRETKRYLDLSIKCGSQTYRCHRIVLAIASDYFDALFAGNLNKSNVVLQEVDADTFEQVLNYAYTGKMTINAGNVCNLFRASNFFGLPHVEQQCAKFVENRSYLLTVENILDIFDYVVRAGRNELKRKVIVNVAEKLDAVYKTDLFVQTTLEDLMKVLERYCLMRTRNEDTLLSAVIRWVHHERAQRFQYLDKFWKMIRWEKVSLQFTQLMAEEMIASDPVRPQTRQIMNSFNREEITSLQTDPDPTTLLHVYVRYPQGRKDRIFSIDSTGTCTISGKIPITQDTKWGFSNISTLDNTRLYCSNFCGNKFLHDYSQKFSTFTSVGRQSPLSLTPPPVMLESAPHMCHVTENIYLLRRFTWGENFDYHLAGFVRTNSPNDLNIFSDEELFRNIFAYNYNLDRWFPVPAAKKLQKFSAMTAYNNVVYLIGGEDQTFVQAYDVRTSAWCELPRTINGCKNAASCVLDGKIYVVCGKSVQRLDHTACKWEKLASTNAESQYQLVKPYCGKIYAMKDGDGERRCHLDFEIYSPSSDEWLASTVNIGGAEKKTTSTSSEIVDSVIFK